MNHPAYAFTNPQAEPSLSAYGAKRASVMSQAGFDAAFAEISSWPGYAPTPLVSLPKLAQQLDAEMVVIGTIGRTGLSAAIIGNTAEHVIDRLDCDVLAVKPAGFICPLAKH